MEYHLNIMLAWAHRRLIAYEIRFVFLEGHSGLARNHGQKTVSFFQ